MNKKRFLAVVLAFVMCALSACSLIDNPGEGGNGELKITDDFVVGMFLCVDRYDSALDDYVSYPTNKFDDENAISLYHATRNYQDSSSAYGEFIASPYLSGASLGISNAGNNLSKTNPYGGIEVRSTFAYTYELLGGILYAEDVYQKNGKDEYYVQDGSRSGYLLNAFGGLSVSSEQNIKVSYTDTDGTVKELKYDGKWSLDIKFVDYLISVKIVEFDKNHSVIKTLNIDLASDDFLEYKAQSDCEYIFIEEEYEVKHSGEFYKYPIGTKYTERCFFNKSTESKSHAFNAPVGNGFVKYVGLKIEF